jgi:hypothetical protein
MERTMIAPAAQTARTEAAAAYRRQILEYARRSPAAFCEHVLRDEATGAPIRLAPMHRAWMREIDQHQRLVILSHVESGKSSAITVGRTLFELGRKPSLRVGIVSNTHDQARKLVRAAGMYIEGSKELAELFGLVKDEPWRDEALTIKRPSMAKDPSIRAFGVHGPVTGSRLDLLVIDDIDDAENTRTPEGRDETSRWVFSTLLGRLTQSAKVIVLANAWSPDDTAHRLEKAGWPTFRFPVEKADGTPAWPERWPAERIAAKRAELGPFHASKMLDVVPIADGEQLLRLEWVDEAFKRGAGMYRGDGLFPIQLLNRRNDGTTVLGVDLGVGLSAKHDKTALVTVFGCDDGDRELLNVETFRAELPEIIKRIEQHVARYHVDVVVIEAVAAQAWALQMLERLPCRIVPYKTNGSALALDRQAEALGVELARGVWRFPTDHLGKIRSTDLRELRAGMIRYAKTEHCPDDLAALLFTRWALAEGIGCGRMETGHLNLQSR